VFDVKTLAMTVIGCVPKVYAEEILEETFLNLDAQNVAKSSFKIYIE